MPIGFGIISDTHRFIVQIIPKCASSTLRQEFQQDIYKGYEKYTDHWNPKEIQEYDKYVFLRHPIDRFFSAYFTVYERHIGRALYNERYGIVEDRPLEFLRMEDRIRTIFEFLNHIRTFGFFDPHIRPQSWYLRGYPMQAYYAVEEIESGVNQLRQLYGLPKLSVPLPVLNPVPKHKPFFYRKEEVPDYLIKEIKEVYAEDILLYKTHIGML